MLKPSLIASAMMLWLSGPTQHWHRVGISAGETLEYSVSADVHDAEHLRIRVREAHGEVGPETAVPLSGTPTVRIVRWPGNRRTYAAAIAAGSPYTTYLWTVKRLRLSKVWEEETTLDAYFSESLIGRPAFLIGRHSREYHSLHLSEGSVVYECWTMVGARMMPTRLAVWDHRLRRFKLLSKKLRPWPP